MSFRLSNLQIGRLLEPEADLVGDTVNGRNQLQTHGDVVPSADQPDKGASIPTSCLNRRGRRPESGPMRAAQRPRAVGPGGASRFIKHRDQPRGDLPDSSSDVGSSLTEIFAGDV